MTFKLKSFEIKHSNMVDIKLSCSCDLAPNIVDNENILLINGLPDEFLQFDNNRTSFAAFADIFIEFVNKCAIDELSNPTIFISFSKHASNRFIKS